jgi:molybdenum cofactor biosynthesis enzyme MoaA
MKINPDTFCSAAWFGIRNRQDMTKTVCCQLDWNTQDPGTEQMSPLDYLNSTKVTHMRKQMHEGKKVPQCQQCWTIESQGRRSLRLNLNDFISNGRGSALQSSWLQSYFNRKNDFQTDQVMLTDIKIGNTCNFACVMCNPKDSSMIYNYWMKNKDNEFVQQHLQKDPKYFENAKFTGFKQNAYRDYIQDVLENNNKVKRISLLGGEPTLDEKLFDILYNIPEDRKKSISLNIITNGSNNILDRTKKLGQYAKIHWTISLEGISDVQDYARYGSNWNVVEKHILQQAKYDPHSVTVAPLVQATTITGLPQLINWANSHNIPLHVQDIYAPTYLGLDSVPTELKQKVIKELEQISDFTVAVNDENIPWDMSAIINTINDSNFDDKKLAQFKNYLKFYEKDRQMKTFLEVCPQWRTYFEV